MLNFVDQLKLDINTVGCQLSGLSVKGFGSRLVGAGFETHESGFVDAHC